MIRALACAGSLAFFSAFGQVIDNAPRFEIADVHVSPKATGQRFLFPRMMAPRGGRYEITNATMVDLIRSAYGFDPDKVLGGPNWLEMDRFDVIAKIPADSAPDSYRLMLQSLLTDRFRLAFHKETRPLPTYALTVGKKPQLKQADGTGDTGCRPQTGASGPPPPPGPPGEGGAVVMRLMTAVNGTPTTINLGPGMVIQYSCRNMTMAVFAEGLRNMMGAGTETFPNPVRDETGLEGRWNFDVKWSMQFLGPMASTGDRITIFDAIEKQLGLKLEQRQVPTPVLVVDSVNRTPTPNPPGVSEALPPAAVPKEFEVADIKPAAPGAGMGGRFQLQPGGKLTVQNMPMRTLLMRAFNTNSPDEIVDVPDWTNQARFDITAKTAASGPAPPALDIDTVAPLLRGLLADRFGLKYHTEERMLPAYTLVAGKPKMKKADPAGRTWCKTPNAPPGSPPGSQVLACQNITMAEFAERLQHASMDLNSPILDATKIEGGWDFTLTYTQNFGGMMIGNRGGDAGPAGPGLPTASDPSGSYTVFEAIEKQLGLKLEMQKRSLPVTVIDHLEQKPTDN